jgi:hypothetical protein
MPAKKLFDREPVRVIASQITVAEGTGVATPLVEEVPANWTLVAIVDDTKLTITNHYSLFSCFFC